MKKHGKTSNNLFGAALEYSDGVSKTAIVFLCIVSFLCAACNVAIPLLQKIILSQLDLTSDSYLYALLFVSIGSAALLILENYINISILMRLRHELECAMEFSLAFKEQPMISEKGVGVYAAAITGDSEQIGRVMAASWFSIGFNLIGAVISIIISATWKHYFLAIALVAYALILVIIFISAVISAKNFRKEREISYVLGAKIREMVETNNSIMAYGSYLEYQKRLAPELEARARYVKNYERAAAFSTSLIRMIEMTALAVFFFFAVHELRGMPDMEQRFAEFPVIIALVGYFDTIFVPVGSLNTTIINASKFRAFYSSFKEIVSNDGVFQIPGDLHLEISSLSVIRDGVIYFSSLDLDVDKTYYFTGMDGEHKALLISFLHGEKRPQSGEIRLGGANLSEIEKNFRLGLLSINSKFHDVFGEGLEYNVTMGKKLLSDEEYDAKKEEYFENLRTLFELIDDEEATKRKNRPFINSIFADFFALDSRVLCSVSLQNAIISAFKTIEDRERFIQEIGLAVFAKKYARWSRYNKLIDELGLRDLETREFGVSAKKLLESERATMILARFLLPETKNPFVLIDPMEHIPASMIKTVAKAIKEAIHDRNGIIFSSDFELMRGLADEIVYFEEGYVHGKGTHAKLMKSCKDYHDFYMHSGFAVKK